MYFAPSCCCLLSAGKKTSKSQSSNLSRSLESLGKESDDSRVSQCNKGHLRSAYLDHHTTGNRCDTIQVTGGQDTNALTALAIRAVSFWSLGYFPVANKSSLLFLVCNQIFGNFSLRISAPSIFLLLEFSTEWFALRNLTIFRFSGNLWRKFLCHLPLFLNLCSMESALNATGNSGNVGSNGKRPSKTLEWFSSSLLMHACWITRNGRTLAL